MSTLDFSSGDEVGGRKILAASKLAGFNKPKPKRVRKEPKLYIVDDIPGGKFINPGNSGEHVAELSLDQAISQGLVNPDQINKTNKVKVPVDPKAPVQEPVQEEPAIIGQILDSDIPMLDVPPLPKDRPVPSVINIHPGSGEIPEDLLADLIMSIKTEKAAGHAIKVIDQDGNEVNGLSIVRPSSPNMSMF